VVVAVSEMPLDPEGPQNFGTLDDSPARMIPLVEPPELGPVFAKAKERIGAAGVKADFVWGVGDPSTTILDAARDRKADVVVLGSHHHGFFSRVLGADVASEVKRAAGCHVIVVE
jgi:nucleotide-binding universal stress UspA family protein